MIGARLALLAAAATLALAGGSVAAQKQGKPDLARPDSRFVPKGSKGTWQAVIARTARGHLIGNPEAKGRLVAFVSYSCAQCADFTAGGEQAIELLLLSPGTMSLEVRPRITSGLDVTVSLLAQCGDPANFPGRHRALMLSQGQWLTKARAAPASQQALWERADRAGRLNAASALGLTTMLAQRGQRISELDACLADEAAARSLRANATADTAQFKLATTPAFVLDGKLIAGVSTWEALYPILSARFEDSQAGN